MERRVMMEETVPVNLVHIALAHLDPKMLTSPDGTQVQVSLEAVARLASDPPPMIVAHLPKD